MSEDVAPQVCENLCSSPFANVQPRPQGAFRWLWRWAKAREKRPGDEVGKRQQNFETLMNYIFVYKFSTNQFLAELTDFP